MTGTDSLQKLAEKHGTTKGAINQRIRRGGWKRDKQQVVHDVYTSVHDTIVAERADQLTRAVRVTDTYMQMLEQWLSAHDPEDMRSIDMTNIATAMRTSIQAIKEAACIPTVAEQTAIDKLRLDQRRYDDEKQAEADGAGKIEIVVHAPEGMTLDE